MRLNVWTAWRVGMRTKTGGDGSIGAVLRQLLRNLHRPERFSWTLRPIDFLRYREFDFALRAISQLPSPQRALDLSSPKLLPLTLAANIPTAQVISTDILAKEVHWTQNKSRELGLNNLSCQVQDARRLPYPSNHFDLITSISVLEHIAPENGGDVPAIVEMARVLRPGGVAVVTVPASHAYFSDHVSADVYERQSGGESLFFQRVYSPELLERNFVDFPGLQLLDLKYVEERYYFQDPRKRIAHLFNCTPVQNLVFGPLFPLLAHIFLSPPRPLEKCSKPYIACMVLGKPRAALKAAA
jgi:ubiquinone/menaquinone biosynthesis C-methylase UbiE